MNRKRLSGLAVTLALVLAACGGGSGGGGTTPPDPVDGLSAEQRATLQAGPVVDPAAIPDWAQTVDAASLADAVSSGQFRYVTSEELRRRDTGAAQRAEAWKGEISRLDPVLLGVLGDLSGTPGDTETLKMPGDGGVGTVRINRPVTELPGYVVALRALADVTVQRPAYASDYQVLQDAAARSGVDLRPYELVDPGRLESADLETVNAARARLETAVNRVGGNLKSSARELKSLSGQTLSALSLDNPTEEEGAINIFGKGYYDRAGSKGRCEGWSSTGLYHYAGFLPSAARWTAVKAQGNRGTCWAFALTAFLEDRKAQATGKRWNFSEQATNAFVKYDVNRQDGTLLAQAASDGEDTIAAFKAVFDRRYSPVLETSWYYNAGAQWPGVPTGQTQTYAGVCKGYDATFAKVAGKYQTWCSETSHEYPVFCVNAGFKVCAVLNVAGNTNLYAAQPVNWGSKVDAWYRPQTTSANASANTTRIQNYAMASWTAPVVISVDSRYLQPDASGFVPDLPVSVAPGSNHAVVLVDYLSEAETKQYLPQNRWTTGGYLVIRNSWGDCWGDSGFAYVPLNWAKKYTFKYARVVD
ncbi:C1 family peptidase [Deinococcus sp. Leaf326]|uniref:C1 family peptidase n=1 Tax=Deinococcus sp. Leaf326 TaxID=1736338 RepID=UPI0009E72E45|nr:C1 family peptidase [Deinococcus sp. Leaf326]